MAVMLAAAFCLVLSSTIPFSRFVSFRKYPKVAFCRSANSFSPNEDCSICCFTCLLGAALPNIEGDGRHPVRRQGDFEVDALICIFPTTAAPALGGKPLAIARPPMPSDIPARPSRVQTRRGFACSSSMRWTNTAAGSADSATRTRTCSVLIE